MIRLAALLLAAALASCGRRPPAQPVATGPRYTVGAAYQSGGIWYYPKEQSDYDATGLASVIPDRRGTTTDGEAYDATALVAAHPTLQLPAIVRVTDLENGRQLLVRVNDRGPGSPGRLIGLSRRAADLLGVPSGGTAQVRVQIEADSSQRLAASLGGGPHLNIAAAPRDAVQSEALPPPGAGPAVRPVPRPAVAAPSSADAPPVPDRLPETVQEGAASPGQLWIRGGEFGRRDYAQRQSAQLRAIGASVDVQRRGRDTRFGVRAGPFGSVGQADSALDQALRAGITDARIVVE